MRNESPYVRCTNNTPFYATIAMSAQRSSFEPAHFSPPFSLSVLSPSPSLSLSLFPPSALSPQDES
jgi:hypothetical protein